MSLLDSLDNSAPDNESSLVPANKLVPVNNTPVDQTDLTVESFSDLSAKNSTQKTPMGEWKRAKKWLFETVKNKNQLCYYTSVASEMLATLTPYAIWWGFAMSIDALIAGTSYAVPAAVIAGSFILERLNSSLGGYVQEKDAYNQAENLNNDYYDTIPKYTEEQLQSEALRQEQTIVRENFDKLTDFVNNQISLKTIYLGFALGAGSVLAANISPILLGVAALAVVPRLIKHRAYAKDCTKLEEELTNNKQKHEWLDHFFVDNNALIEAKGLQQSKYLGDEAKRRYKITKDEELKLEFRHTIKMLLSEVTEDAVLLTGMALALYGIAAGTVTAGGAFIAWYALQEFQDSMGGLTDTLSRQIENKSFVRKISHTLTNHSNDAEHTPPEERINWQEGPPDIKIDNISVRHNDQENFALLNLSLNINGGETIVLIGDSGAGKSSLSNVIQGVLTPDSGSVVVDQEINISDIRHEWRSHVRKLNQDSYLFTSLTFRQILEMGYSPFYERVYAAEELCKQVGLHSVLESKGKKYDTTYGSGLDLTATDLSSGEKHRLALVRTLLGNPKILILDEPTSDLDPKLSAALPDIINSLKGDRTTIFVTHDIASIMRLKPDRIIAMKNGKILEQGSIEELLAIEGGYFKEMHGMERDALDSTWH